MTEVDIIVFCIVFLGLIIIMFGVVGTILFPDLFFRLHASTKCGTTGSATILLGLMIYSGDWGFIIKLFIILVFLFITSPIISHAIAVSAVKNKVELLHTKGERYADR
ncbi:MAG: monovalent cation/H(+) antiporter subunit G [Candidatus Muiribacteriaceae bacterium]